MDTLRFGVTLADAAEAQHRLRADVAAHTVDSTVEITAEAAGGPVPAAADTGVIVALDFAPQRLAETRRAVAAAITALPDGMAFAVLHGGGAPRICYPYDASEVWAYADDISRNTARFEAERLLPAGGGTGGYAAWLDAARAHVAREPRRIAHLLVITDGRGHDDGRLDAAIDACAETLTCDVIGVGGDWEPALPARIATRLHGRAELAEGAGPLAARLADIAGRLRSTRVPAVPVEVRLRAGVTLRSFREAAPVSRELRPDPHPAGADPWRHVFSTRLWDAGTRRYILSVEARPDGDPAAGREADMLEADLLLAQVALGPGVAALPGRTAAAVRVRWSYDAAPGRVRARGASATYLLRDDLAEAFNAGCTAISRGDLRTAAEMLGAAAKLAYALRDRDFLDHDLNRVAEVLDAANGVVRVRAGAAVDRPAVLRNRLSRGQDRPLDVAPPAPAGIPCPAPGCGRLATAAAAFCVACGTRLAAAGSPG
ncbi:VWA domain-containing protein [Streptomyces sp. CMB-StM0423]|uniref:VWA domain-containing protein n=1 Tax=Streptomyces sp. CMB-StM0423 TaxID=2059884 RepID=UPI000C70F7E7|nr:VWA domain-containing protein [Streptomyces sp. CMB-StM0423]AUH42959.1 hypothetical protein CXR04_24765 [Streptomyces sp. CMB-StM0423]